MNTIALIITVGLQRDVENGDIGAVVVEMTEENAANLLNEQEECSLCAVDGAVTNLINAYAVLCGYIAGLFVKAELLKEGQDGKS